MFDLIASTPLGRRGRISTRHGTIETPVFFPVGTGGAMRGISLEELDELQSQVLLCNTYHLHLQPGEDVVAEAGGLHAFINWEKPILTDSGGFQVFSLRENLKVEAHGVHFRSHLNGDPLFLGPSETTRIQWSLMSDIHMCFDQCVPSTAPREDHEKAVERTLRWAEECMREHEMRKKPKNPTKPRVSSPSPLLFAIIQGGLHRDLRKKCAEELIAIGFDGYAIGGLAVGESEEEMFDVLKDLCPMLPEDTPRYLMGVGRLSQMRTAIALGIDMFDCVLPMREGRHGKIYLSNGEMIRIIGGQFTRDHSPIDPNSPSPMSRVHRKSYLNYLLRAGERLGETIACLQNIAVTLKAVEDVRREIEKT